MKKQLSERAHKVNQIHDHGKSEYRVGCLHGIRISEGYITRVFVRLDYGERFGTLLPGGP